MPAQAPSSPEINLRAAMADPRRALPLSMWPADSNPLASMFMWPALSAATPQREPNVWPTNQLVNATRSPPHPAPTPAPSAWPTVMSSQPPAQPPSAVASSWPAVNRAPSHPVPAPAPSAWPAVTSSQPPSQPPSAVASLWPAVNRAPSHPVPAPAPSTWQAVTPSQPSEVSTWWSGTSLEDILADGRDDMRDQVNEEQHGLDLDDVIPQPSMWPDDTWTRLFEDHRPKARRQYMWHLQVNAATVPDLIKHVDSQPRHATRTSQKHRCQICYFNLDGHYMVYRLLDCTSPPCGNSCGASMKILTCLSTMLSSVFHHGRHTDGDHTVPHRMSLEMKAFIKSNASNGALPMRILAEMIPKLKLTEVSAPRLCQVQRVANYFKKKTLMDNSLVAQMADTARRLFFRADMDEVTPFVFATPTDQYGIPYVGNGSDERPFLIGVSTKRLIRVLARAAEYPLHIDGTHKVSQQGYPMVVVGVSDAARSIHLAAVFLSSHLRGLKYATMFASLFSTYEQVTGLPLRVKHVAGDAEDAQFNGFRDVVLASCPSATYLMCFFHVQQKVKLRVAKMTDSERRLAFKHVYRIHHARNEDSKTAAVATAIEVWKQTPKFLAFSSYFIQEWINSRFDGWQCYRRAIGQATTNNPLEQFNKAFKRDYTQRRLLPMNGLMEKMKLLCKTKSTVVEEFKFKMIITPDLPRRLKYLAKAGLISHTRVQRARVDFILSGAPVESEIVIRQHGIEKRGFPLSKTDQTRRHTLYAEVYGQPATGWTVNITERRCPCDWWFKFGCCVHLVEALTILDVPMDLEAALAGETFISRRKQKRRREDMTEDGTEDDQVAVPNRGGRPQTIGPALSLV